MSDAKDSAIKLFGRTIKLPEIPSESGLDYSARFGEDGIVRHRSSSPSSLAEGSDLAGDGAKPDYVKGIREGDGVEVDISNELVDPTGMKENPKAPSREEQNESSESQDKSSKKPDNLIPCPRCNSLDTKFCYYNNYNVSQPRHFCKNCHRYWTAGGTIRNVAVGAGRRKNKNLVSQCRQLTVLETPQNGREELTTNAIHPTLKPNSTLLSSGESMASVLNIAEKSVHDLKSNGYSPVPPTAAYCPVGFSMPFFPAVAPPYVGCSMPGSWSVPWLNSLPASQHYENQNNDHNSPALGKHSRDDDSLMKHADPENDEPLKGNNSSEKSLWVPKTLRIVDPEEAAKSSLWSKLGIKDDKVDSANGGGRLKAHQSKGDNKFKVVEASTLLQAKPSAALSRSLSFHESSWDKAGRS